MYNYLFKFILIGDMACGKSSICGQFVSGTFNYDMQSTIGVDFSSKTVNACGYKIKLQIWDLAGNKKFEPIVNSYYKNTAGVIIVYDITSRESFNNLTQWIKNTENLCNDGAVITLVGNKNDLISQRKVTFEEGFEFAKKNNCLFFETSARNGTGINDIFEKTAELVHLKLLNDIVRPDGTIGIKVNNFIGIESLSIPIPRATHTQLKNNWDCQSCKII
jgi:small GTP-binding protein